jgi:tRNA-dihydrouridine synthase B
MTATLQKSAVLPAPIQPDLPLTALAPMQDVTDLLFMQVVADYGSPDYFFTEYFRVYDHSSLDPHILRSITENATGRPVFAQLIGENISDLLRTAKVLSRYPIAGIDLNMGCPAPRVYLCAILKESAKFWVSCDKILMACLLSKCGLALKMRPTSIASLT